MRLGVIDERAVVVRGDRAADARWASKGRLPTDPMLLLADWARLREWAAGLPDGAYDIPVDSTALGAPVPRPRQVFAIALNYPPHAAEAGFTPPGEPLVFTKFPACITGPHTTVALPRGKVDWEVELVAVIGRDTYRVSEDRAWAAVAGLTVGQDLSERVTQLQGKPAQFGLGKSFPGFGPIGPVLVTPDEFDDPDDLEITGLLNGEAVQHDRTKSMIFPVPELIARLSAVVPLFPGDLIFTGTPAGVGNRMNPPRYLTESDELVSRIEGIGEIRQRFTAVHP
ncbi:2-keto-4-pentenoate hydratase/2-oxohepta-3-ene-1,7-dioic acid hydratase in catechol pathway [Streptomyces sp. SAI-208]|uniref:fumarylacetoacetate hydrolase family protein n=1 Tax=Streptomyces sp. SAI-208 TaxID=2940550 RepID=UPI0024772748|nr:fumarylacetoacetate hydrolase family protein [Streptomyces sp. SAI-208]MDH6604791.1 2-keto-4-pentenoate hydratase/2-oxohepta-3-ene-1,7-dioic acid hydratase in catechol pathway [Streptomyces sp. SAI-208]